MPYTLDLSELSFARVFASPKFEVAANVGRILQVMHEKLSPHFAIKLSDLSALAGSSMGDVGARIRIGDGQVTIEVTPERFSIVARSLRTREELAAARHTASLTEETVTTLFPGADTGETTTSIFGWMKRGADTDPSATEILSKAAPSSMFKTTAGEGVVYPLRMRLQNREEGYLCEFVCDEALLPNTQLFISFTLKAFATSPHKKMDDLSVLGESLIERWFGYLQVPLPSPEESLK